MGHPILFIHFGHGWIFISGLFRAGTLNGDAQVILCRFIYGCCMALGLCELDSAACYS